MRRNPAPSLSRAIPRYNLTYNVVTTLQSFSTVAIATEMQIFYVLYICTRLFYH